MLGLREFFNGVLMKKLLLSLLLLMSFNSFGFDYHGIKSGMSKDEVKALTKCKEATECDSDDAVGDDKVFLPNLNIPSLWSVQFSYTSDDKLWRISLYFIEQSGASGVAQKRALDELYECCQNQSERVGGSTYGFNLDLIVAQLIDEQLFMQDVDKIYNEQIGLY